jgi:hypothetical protein
MNRPELAIGVDEDGDPACALHAVKRNDVEVQINKTKLDAIRRPAPVMQRQVADPVKEMNMSLENAPKCLAPDCEVRTNSAVGYCAKHYFLSKTKNQGEAPTCTVCGETLRRDNATGLCKKHRGPSHPKKAAAPKKKAVVKAAAALGIKAPKAEPLCGLVDLGKLKCDLLAKLAAVELVEKALREV